MPTLDYMGEKVEQGSWWKAKKLFVVCDNKRSHCLENMNCKNIYKNLILEYQDLIEK